MIKKLLAILAGIVLAFTMVSAALAAGSTSSTPPTEVIKYRGKVVQTTFPYEYDWHYYDGGWKHTTWTDEGYVFPTTQQVYPDTRINVVINSPLKPDKLNIRNYHPLRDGSPPAGGEFVRSHLYPIRNKSGEIIKWGAWFTVEWGNLHHNLVITTKWLPDPGTKHPYATEVRLAHVR